jgi:excisionase family DNA binding protein
MTDDVAEARLLSVEDVALQLQVRKQFIYNAAASGLIGYVKVGRHLRFKKEHVDQYIDRGTVAAVL